MDRKEKWNERYRGGRHAQRDPSEILIRWEPELPKGRALDLACGAGRNSIYLAKKGYSVNAIDYSDEALKIAQERAEGEGVEVNWIRADLNEHDLPEEAYDLVLVSHLHPEDNLEKIKRAVKPGGAIVYEHHVNVDEPMLRGPSDSDILFEPNELLNLFSDFQILEYREGIEEREDGDKSALAKLVAVKTDSSGRGLFPFPEGL